MGEIVITYVTVDKEKKEITFDSDVEIIQLDRKEIASIDLTPLSKCTSLQELDLSNNQLQSIVLTPLFWCISLRELVLGYNQLQGIDLSPLSSCTCLQRIYLNNNQLKDIDLNPLSSCTSLQGIYLNNNQLQFIDLTPLSYCISLKELYIKYNQLHTIDLTPLAQCSDLTSLFLDRPIQALIFTIPESKGKYPHALVEMIKARQISFLDPSQREIVEYHCKVLLIGEPRGGKTHLVWRLIHSDSETQTIPPFKTTEGVEQHTVKWKRGGIPWVANIWDFGGQAEHSNVHQLFFSERGLYLFVFKPDVWRLVNLDRWYRIFRQNCRQGGLLFPHL